MSETERIAAPQRIPYGQETRYHAPTRYDARGPLPMPTTPCHDCRAAVGKLHQEGCDWEQCETCGAQRISCSCCTVCRSGGDTWCVCGACIDKAESVAALRARVAALEAALAPFAQAAEVWINCPDYERVTHYRRGDITVGDLRRARRVLAGEEP